MIRKYQENDMESLLEVWHSASSLAHPFLNAAFMTKERKNIREIYIPNTETWVHLTDDILDGFISMIDNEVGAIFVHPDQHGQGIGRSLMDLVAQRHKELEVEVFKDNHIGREFYEKYGFEIIKEHQHEETGRALLRMKCTA